LGILLVYSTLFAIGELIFGTWGNSLLLIGLAVISALIMVWNLNRTGWVGLSETAEAIPSEAGD
jgi:solute:Na+ symporter, SSS family